MADEAVTLDVGGMTCDGCAGKVRNALESVSGVLSAVVSHESGSAVVSHSGISRNLMADAVREIGYTVDGRAEEFHWRDGSVWNQSAYNTMWCLIGCSIGDLGTIAYFQLGWTESEWTTMAIMMLAIMNGLLTSIALETVILLKQLPFRNALRTAAGMSLISMIAMEAAMNITDIVLTGGAMLTWYAIIPMWIAGFLTPWPYNYWRLKKYGVACH